MLRNYLPHYVKLLQLAIPLVLTQAGQMTVQLVDTAMVGRVGTTELAAASFASSLYIVIMLFGLGIFLGVTPLVGQFRGSKNDRQVAGIMRSGFALSGLLVPAITVVALSFSWIMPFIGQPDAVVRLAIPFYRLLAFSTMPFLVFTLLKQIGEGLGNTIMAMAVTIVANILNIILNYLLIFGHMGFPKLGLLGSGCATLTARTVMPLLLYAGFRYLKSTSPYFALMRAAKATARDIKKIFSLGLPIAAQLVLEVSAFSLSAVMMGWLGDVPLAAHQVAMGLASFTFMLANGVAMATTIRVSFQLGTRSSESMERVAYSALHLVLSYMGLCGIGFLMFRHQLPRIFTHDAHVIEVAASLLIVAALFQLFDGLQIVCLGILRGFADVKAPMFISGFSYMVVGLSVSYLCAFTWDMGPPGIWYGFMAGLIAAGVLLALRIRKKIHPVKMLPSAQPLIG
jgi:multidrug resistance protein, MATE family